MHKNNKEILKNKSSKLILSSIVTLLISPLIGWVAGQFLAIPFLLMGRSDPLDSSINYTVNSSQKAIAEYALIIPYCMAIIGFIIGCYLIYKKIKTKNSS